MNDVLSVGAGGHGPRKWWVNGDVAGEQGELERSGYLTICVWLLLTIMEACLGFRWGKPQSAASLS